MSATVPASEIVDRFMADLAGVVALHDGDVSLYDAIAAACPTEDAQGDLFVALIVEAINARRLPDVPVDEVVCLACWRPLADEPAMPAMQPETAHLRFWGESDLDTTGAGGDGE